MRNDLELRNNYRIKCKTGVIPYAQSTVFNSFMQE